jgi:hypothetical protein
MRPLSMLHHLWSQKRLDGAALVHGAVALCHLIKGQREVKELPGLIFLSHTSSISLGR